MDIKRLNIYQRLRDFNVPAAVLDEIFSHEDEFGVLETAWNNMAMDDYTDDQIAGELAQLFKKEIQYPDDPNQEDLK